MDKEKISNNIVLFSTLTIVLSVFAILLSFGKLGITGAADAGYGYTNVTVTQTTDITVVTSFINFTDTATGGTKQSGEAGDVANCATDAECGINITNDGSIAINISFNNTQTLFTGATLDESTHYLYNVTYGDNSTDYLDIDCKTGGAFGLQFNYTDANGSGWRAIPPEGSSEVAVCRLNATDSKDSVFFEINITVPVDEPAGTKSGILGFIASTAGTL